MWKNCGFDSVLVPTTQKQEIVRLSNQFVNKLVGPELAPKVGAGAGAGAGAGWGGVGCM